MFQKQRFGIDPGSDLIKIYNARKNTLLKEKNMVAVMDEDNYLAVGNDAYEMYEKNPKNVDIILPMTEGMIADISSLEVILYSLLRKSSPYLSKRAALYFAVPTDMTQIEKRAYYMLTRNVAFRNTTVYLVNRPIADALALGISVRNTKGDMIVNIGAQSTEFSIITGGKIIISKKIPPRRLFSNIFPIAFNGISNIFPKKHTASRPHAYARKMPASIPNSISFPPQKNQEMTGYHLLIIFHISIFYYKPTVLFFLQQLSGE